MKVVTTPSGNPLMILTCRAVIGPATAGEADVECATAFEAPSCTMAKTGQAPPAGISYQPEDVHPLLINGGGASGARGVQVNQLRQV